MGTYSYSDALFRAQFPAFSNTTTYPVILIENYWTTSGTIIANSDYGILANMGGPQALYLMTAHLTQLGVMIGNGETPAVQTGAGIDKINITLMPPPIKTQFQYWLSTTAYGQQLLAMLQAASVGGFYAPGGMGKRGFGDQINGGWYC